METIKLEDLIGEHKLTGVDIGNIKVKQSYGDYFEDSQCISFVLDGKTYTAIENPDDGYRSSMREIGISDVEVKNKFPEVKVLVRKTGAGEYQVNDSIEFIDVENGKIIMEVGTRNVDDYYPCFVSQFSPENMSINEGKE